MTDNLTTCPHCGSDACYVVENAPEIKTYSCFGCGFTSNSTLREDKLEEVEAVMPQLYIDLKFRSVEGLYWYPSTVILEDKSMVFADGKSVEDWKWAGVQSKDGKADMSTVKHFEEKDFMEALDYIGFFEKQK